MSADTLIAAAEKQLATLIVDKIVLALGISGAAFSGPAAFAIGAAVNFVVHYGDVLGFMLASDWRASDEAKAFESAAAALEKLPKDVSDDDIKKAQQAKIDAFNTLVGVGSK